MIWLIFSLLIIAIILWLNGAANFIVEILFTAVFIWVGLIGILPFFLQEYLNITCADSAFYLFLICLLALLFSLYRYIKTKPKTLSFHFNKLNLGQSLPTLLVILVSIILLARSLVLPIQGWDAYSMYDARAKMILNGSTFAQFRELSQYDNFNQNYYLSYPPMTSVIHAVFYANNIPNPMFIYTLSYLAILFISLGIFNLLSISSRWQITGLLLLIPNSLLLSQTGLAYTNLVTIGLQMLCIYYLVNFTLKPQLQPLFFSGLFLGFTNWTRNEPLYYSFVITLGIVLLTKKIALKNKLIYLVAYYLLATIWRIAWEYYLSSTSNLTSLNLSVYDHSSFAIITKLLSSLRLANLLEVSLFLSTTLRPLIPYLILIPILFITRKTTNSISKISSLFLSLILTQLAITTVGVLYFSQTYPWWNEIGGSMLRSSLLLIPLTVIYTSISLSKQKS